mgnify:CR=1 FL=1
MLKTLMVTWVVLILAGCNNNSNSLDGQVEKCVQAGIKMREPYPSEKERREAEVHWRIHCLRAASGTS